ncbi:platelet glycoprotein VI-like [Eleutherodactylus coqui]|uniref:platelet glycoprotein VI-like n=1 Tax=Eleutherodactylus coqui TaxID=57060 RepID=UPI00346373D5
MNIHVIILLAGLCMAAVVSSSDIVPPPKLSASPDYAVYYKGEQVTLTCNTHEKYRKAYVTFYKNSKYIPTDTKKTYSIHGMEDSDVGKYVCDFWTGSHSSPRSNEVLLQTSDKLLPPVISLNPSLSVYPRGELVTLVCSPPKRIEVKRIRFYKEENVQLSEETDKNTYVISASSEEVAGRYSCTYFIEMQQKWRSSPSSEYIVVNVSAAETTAATIIPRSTALDLTSKTRPTETFSPTQSNEVTNSTTESIAGTMVSQLPEVDVGNKTQTNKTRSLKSFLNILVGGLILIISSVLIQGLVHICIQLNGKRRGTMTEAPMRLSEEVLQVPESDLHSVHNLKTTVETSFYPSPLKEMEAEHFYSEIELPIENARPPIVSVYTTAKAIDPLHPVYQTDLATQARN